MFSIWILIIAPVSVWRITNIVEVEKIAQPLRNLFGIKHDVAGNPVSWPQSFFGYLLGCFWCLSVWVSIFVAIAVYVFPYVLLPFFFSALAIWYHELDEKLF